MTLGLSEALKGALSMGGSFEVQVDPRRPRPCPCAHAAEDALSGRPQACKCNTKLVGLYSVRLRVRVPICNANRFYRIDFNFMSGEVCQTPRRDARRNPALPPSIPTTFTGYFSFSYTRT